MDVSGSLAPPPELGRHLVIGPRGPIPPAWDRAPVIRLERIVDVDRLVDTLQRHAINRDGAVIVLSGPAELQLDRIGFTPDQTDDSLQELLFEELHHLIWYNAIDLRCPQRPIWWALEAAERLGARPTRCGRGDAVTAGGDPFWIDAGPIHRLDPIDAVPVVHAVNLEHGHLVIPPTGRGRGGHATEQLAPDQRRAVSDPHGTVCVVAPAGSGKTTVLVARARALLLDWGLPATAVKMTAFNRRAEHELQTRCADLDGLGISTLNALALAIVAGTPPFAPQPQAPVTLPEQEFADIVTRLLPTCGVPGPVNNRLPAVLQALRLLRLGLEPPEHLTGPLGIEPRQLRMLHHRVQAALDRRRRIDFDGQIERATEILRTDRAARRCARVQCRVLLVDEFQDLTPAHLLLIRLLSGCGGAVFAVGDADQTIYGYQGASPTRLSGFERHFAGARGHRLEINYRCPSTVVSAVNHLLAHQPGRHSAQAVRPRPGAGTAPIEVVSDRFVTSGAVAAIKAAIAHGRPASQIAVLARTNAAATPVALGLHGAGIGVRSMSLVDLSRRASVAGALEYLACCEGRSARPELAHHIEVLAGLLNAGASLRRWFDVLVNEFGIGAPPGCWNDDLWALGELIDLLDTGATGATGAAGAVAACDPRDRGWWPKLTALLRWVASGQHSACAEGVTVSTVHRVKGLEWPMVVVVGVGSEQFPHRLAEDHEEERRIFHVAITRASERLVLIAPPDPSPYLAEITSPCACLPPLVPWAS